MATLGYWAAQNLFPPLVAYRNARSLAANVAESVSVPEGANKAVFRCSGDFAARGDGTAAWPTDIDDGTGSAVNPAGMAVGGLTSISVIAPTACVISVDFFK